jgi:hypothetical protein
VANADHLILAIGVGAIVATILFGALVQPPLPEDPYDHIRFSAQGSEYAIGETARFVVENHGPKIFTYTGWGILRLVEDEWVAADCLAFTAELHSIGPFDRLDFGWPISRPNPSCEADINAVYGPLPPFGPGRFAASIFLSLLDREVDSDLGHGWFLAEFDVV